MILAMSLTVPVPLLAQSSESPASRELAPIVTDRPSESAGPTVVPRRALQVEMGYKFSRLVTDDRRTNTHELPDLLLRVGVLRGLEARLTAIGYGFRNQDSDGRRDEQAGFNDVSVGVKWVLTEQEAGRPALSLRGRRRARLALWSGVGGEVPPVNLLERKPEFLKKRLS